MNELIGAIEEARAAGKKLPSRPRAADKREPVRRDGWPAGRPASIMLDWDRASDVVWVCTRSGQRLLFIPGALWRQGAAEMAAFERLADARVGLCRFER